MNLGSHILLNAVSRTLPAERNCVAHSMLATIPDNSITLFDKLLQRRPADAEPEGL